MSKAIQWRKDGIFLKFIYLFWEREREDPKQAQRWQWDVGLEPTNHEIMTWAEIQIQMLNWLSHPGAPKRWSFEQVMLEQLDIHVQKKNKINLDTDLTPLQKLIQNGS